MEKPDYHILVCMSFRGLEPKGKCIKQGGGELLQYLESEIADRGLNAFLSSTGCLQFCDQGPVMVIYPQGYWYGGITDEDQIDEILDALEEGRAAEEYLLA
ncbi:(2Fe-2S) ferredoxin domain-containing protein [Desulfohalobiaceae bacterium Ax17]|uniref:(2Fe-2S) ferredoxin domain-containing protein n=1 Tax=Desulfovulcanus ferrireducens TaxID=2831190 RepID=UPI00207BB9F0|nr:(2Fe-2S) ferredoxin domain-containing protein [Desulfovulcanus ferrireducens]MBT8764533.1 (2Fe-2S) ferredoxin domain-containing protein [Desulfovulcanus ferrireducens]